MGWFTDFFSYELKKGQEDKQKLQQVFEERLDAAIAKQEAE
jgi:hypothetical protein